MGSETYDANVLCDLYSTVPAVGKTKLTNWCGAKGGTGDYVNGPCTGTAGAWRGVTCTSGRVTYLNLSNVGLGGGSIPSQLGRLTGLTYLGLGNNALTGPVPASFCSLKSSIDLRVQSNPGLTCYPSCLSTYSQFMSNKDAPLSAVCSAVPETDDSEEWTAAAAAHATLRGPEAVDSSGQARRSLAVSAETSDGDLLCYLYNTCTAAGKAALTNWCGAKSDSTGDYVNGPCTGTAGQWYGVTCTSDRVTYLSLFSNSLSGSIPSSLGALTGLTDLGLFSNSLSGSIPSSLGGLTGLTYLGLFSNSLSGSIPSSLGALTGLTYLGLKSNRITGSIPSSLGGLTWLTQLDLNTNSLSGSIPSFLGGLTRLTNIWLNTNSLSGSIPSSLGALTGLTDLRLYGNSLTGSIPSSLGGLTGLTYLDLSSNSLTGPVPASFCSLKPSAYLNVQNNPGLTCYPSCLSSFSQFSKDLTPRAVCDAAPTTTTIIIAVAVSVGVVLSIALVYWCLRRRRSARAAAKEGADAKKGAHSPAAAADSTWVDAGAEAGAGQRGVATGAAAAGAAVELVALPSSPQTVTEAIAEPPMPPLLPAASATLVAIPVPAPPPLSAWESGRAAIADASAGAAAAAEALAPGLLSIAREFPLVGPCAGVLLQFYRVYKTVRANHAAYAALKEQCDLGANWMREIAPQLPSIDSKSALVEQALQRVVAAVHHATQVVSALSLRLDAAEDGGRSLAGRLRGALATAVLSGADREKLDGALTWLKEAIAYLLQTIPTITGLQVKAKLDRVGDGVSAIVAMLSDYSQDKGQAALRASKLQELTLLASEIRLGAVIGQGGFSTVHAGIFHNAQVAVKVVKRRDGGRLNQLQKEAVENELIMTRFLADPNILTCYGLCHEVDRTLVVLELAPYGSLWDLLCPAGAAPSMTSSGDAWGSYGVGTLVNVGSALVVGLGGGGGAGAMGADVPFSLSLGWLRDLSSAVGHLYAKGVKHKDIKAENLLVYAYPDRLVAKLCDFGFARQSSATMSVASGGTANFEAPEVRLTGKGSFASDVFSVGMTAVQILTRQAPARQDWQEQVVRAVGAAQLPATAAALRAQQAVQALLLRCVESEQAKRPNALECAAALEAALSALGGDPRIDRASPEYDAVEAIEDRVKAATRGK